PGRRRGTGGWGSRRPRSAARGRRRARWRGPLRGSGRASLVVSFFFGGCATYEGLDSGCRYRQADGREEAERVAAVQGGQLHPGPAEAVGEGPLPFQVGAVPHVVRSEEVLELLLEDPALLLGGREQVGELRQGCALVETCVAAGDVLRRGCVGVDHPAPAPVTGPRRDDLGRPCAVVVTQGDCDRGEVGETPAPPTGRGLGAQQRPSHLPPVPPFVDVRGD